MLAVELHIPSISRIYDFVVPAHVTVSNIIQEFIRVMKLVEPNIYLAPENAVLCDLGRQIILDSGTTLARERIMDGSCLMLI